MAVDQILPTFIKGVLQLQDETKESSDFSEKYFPQNFKDSVSKNAEG